MDLLPTLEKSGRRSAMGSLGILPIPDPHGVYAFGSRTAFAVCMSECCWRDVTRLRSGSNWQPSQTVRSSFPFMSRPRVLSVDRATGGLDCVAGVALGPSGGAERDSFFGISMTSRVHFWHRIGLDCFAQV